MSYIRLSQGTEKGYARIITRYDGNNVKGTYSSFDNVSFFVEVGFWFVMIVNGNGESGICLLGCLGWEW